MDYSQHKIVVAIPCFNEEKTIAKVVSDFRRELPEVDIIVYDNNSIDQSVECARQVGAIVKYERKQGKGYVIQAIFNHIEADIYILVDGDDTYIASDIHELLIPVIEDKADMVIGNRLKKFTKEKNKSLHQFGNWFLVLLMRVCFGARIRDVLSGYRVCSRSFVENIPVISSGFEIETELTLQALERGLRVQEIPINYQDRPKGSESKLRPFHDGYRIMSVIISLLRDYRPMIFFPALSAIFIIAGLVCGTRVILAYLETGFVHYLPTAVLAITLIILGFISFIGGLIVSAINRRYEELVAFQKRTNKLK